MQASDKNNRKISIIRTICVITAIIFNVTFNWIADRLGIPLYLDTAGTIAVSCIVGLVPGIATALISNIICALYNPTAVYFSLLGILIAMLAAYYSRKGLFKKPSVMAVFVFLAAIAGGGIGAIFQLILLGRPQFDVIRDAAAALAPSGGAAFAVTFIIVNTGLNIIDKGISTILVFFLMLFVPEDKIAVIQNAGRFQRPLSKEEITELKGNEGRTNHTLLSRITITLIMASVSLTVVMTAISIRLYSDNVKMEYTQNAMSAARFAANAVDPDTVDHYIRKGKTIEGDPEYQKTKAILDNIRLSTRGVKYLYVLKVERDGCYFVFDSEPYSAEAYAPGDKAEFEEAFEPYIDDLLAGEAMEPVESNSLSEWLLTVYVPVRNSEGKTVAFAGADVSMDYLSSFVKNYLIRILLIFSGVFALVLAYGLWISRIRMVYPIDSMAQAAYGFTEGDKGQKELDEHVNALKSLEIKTGDEVEKLYHAICRMAENTSEQMREIRYYADINAKMQNGLIMTMADMVENRDSDTGAHIQKTAAYVRIILQGLKKKGYYSEKLTEKYMSDAEMSAPLHDLGKITIPDAILNKPGKLTAEEYEIMKTHTTAGKDILEKAIETVQGGSYLKEARNMAAYHHERWDGKGYPDGLYGQVIPLSARVMAVADVFDALVSPRIYKPPFSLERALEIIEEGAGSQFDPKCVEVFLDSLAEVKQVLKMYQE